MHISKFSVAVVEFVFWSLPECDRHVQNVAHGIAMNGSHFQKWLAMRRAWQTSVRGLFIFRQNNKQSNAYWTQNIVLCINAGASKRSIVRDQPECRLDMAREIQSPQMKWPSGVRLPVVLTFEHQSGEGAPLLPGERPELSWSAVIWNTAAARGLWNILDVLDKLNVKATILHLRHHGRKVSGLRSRRPRGRPRDRRHELQLRARACGQPSSARRAIVVKTARCSRMSAGPRSRAGAVPIIAWARNTLDMLSSEGFAWDSSMLNDDLPYLFDCAGGASSSKFLSPRAPPTRPSSAIPIRSAAARMAWPMSGTANSRCCIARARPRLAS